MDVQQGNLLDPEQVDQVEVGMTRSQVRFLLGTPMVIDTFDADRWDYVYSLRRGHEREVTKRHLVVWFDGDKVTRVEEPIPLPRPESVRLPAERAAASACPRAPAAAGAPADPPAAAAALRHDRPAASTWSRATSRPKIPRPQAAGSIARMPREDSRALECLARRTAGRHLERQHGLAIALRAGDLDRDALSRHRTPDVARRREGIHELVADLLECRAEHDAADRPVRLEADLQVGARAGLADRREIPAALERA